ncbi:MAG: hypothetical protein AAGD38_03215 [Acidobacteriota bacterium]
MTVLPEILATLADTLRDALGADASSVGGAQPSIAADLPAVTLSAGATRVARLGMGRVMREQTGVFAVTASVDLAAPTIDFGDEQVELLSADRLTLHLPHGPLVGADGSDGPLADADLTVELDGGSLTVVAVEPQSGEVRADGRTGTLSFGTPLPATGTLEVAYHIGRWEVHSSDLSTRLDIEVAAANAEGVDSLSRRLATELDVERLHDIVPTLRIWRLTPLAWGPITPATGTADARRRQLAYDLTASWQVPILPTTGGVIRRVEVTLLIPEPTSEELPTDHLEERFDVV